MAILRKGGGTNFHRAQAIIANINKEEETPTEVVEEVQEVVVVEDQTVVEEIQNEEQIDGNTIQNEEKEEEEKVIDVVGDQSQFSDEDVFLKLSERLGRKIESYDDLKQKEIEVDPELKQLIDWKEATGLSLTQWADYTKDFSKMSDVEVVRETLAKKYPDFTEEELEYSMKEYIYDEDYDDEDDRMRKSISLKKLAVEGRKELEGNKLSLKRGEGSLTKEQQDVLEYAHGLKEAQAQASKAQAEYVDNLKLAAKNLNTVTLNLEEGVTIEHKVDDAVKKDLGDFIVNVPHWFDKDGKPVHQNIAKDGYIIKNFNALLKQAYEQGKSVGLEGGIKTGRNINLDANTDPQGGSEEVKGNIGQVIDNLAGGSKKRFRFRNV